MAVNIYNLQIENARELIKIYSKRSEQLKKSILAIVKSGGDSSILRREKKRIDDILQRLRKELSELVNAQINYSYKQGQEETKKDFKKLKIGLLIGAVLPESGKKELAKIYNSHVNWAITKMQQKLDAFVRKDFSSVNKAVRNVETLAYNRLGLIIPSNFVDTNNFKGLAKFFETQLKARDIFRVPYYHRTGAKAGQIFSHVRTENYCKMLARTLTAEADRKAVTDIIEKTFEPYGDLVQFVRRGGQFSEHTCDDCEFLDGAYLSLHGETKGYTTVSEAEAEYDIFHPNCIHTLRITAGVLQQYEYLGVDVPKEKYVETFTTFKKQAENVANDIKNAVYQKGMKSGTYQKAALDYLRDKIPENTKKETFRIGTISNEIKSALGAKNDDLLLSIETLTKNIIKHQEMSVDEYLSINQYLKNPDALFKKQRSRQALQVIAFKQDNAYYQIVLKSTLDKRENYLQSFHKTDLKNINKELSAKTIKILKNNFNKNTT